MPPIDSLRNIGPKTAAWLKSAGIQTETDLAALGAVEAYRRVKRAFPQQVTLNCLWALQGALIDVEWNRLPAEMKAELRRQLEASE